MQHFLLQCIAIWKRLSLNCLVCCHSLLPDGSSVDSLVNPDLGVYVTLQFVRAKVGSGVGLDQAATCYREQ